MTEDNKKELNLETLEQITGGASSRPSGMPYPIEALKKFMK